MAAADGIDPLVSLYNQWPWLILAVGIARWLASIAERMVSRYASFIDHTELREVERLGTDKQLAVALASISDELKQHGDKLSDIKDQKTIVQCPYIVAPNNHSNPQPGFEA